MNTESIHIDHGTQSNHRDLTAKPISFIRTIWSKVCTFFIRSELEKAQAGYCQKQQRESTNPQDIVSNMPVETKLALGMYRWMD